MEDEEQDAAGREAEADGVGEDLQHHRKDQHHHIVKNKVDVQHIPEGRGGEEKRRGEEQRKKRGEERRGGGEVG